MEPRSVRWWIALPRVQIVSGPTPCVMCVRDVQQARDSGRLASGRARRAARAGVRGGPAPARARRRGRAARPAASARARARAALPR